MTDHREIGTVFVTGGSSGLGAAVAAAVTKAGGTPAVIDRVPPEAGVPYSLADLADSAAAERAVADLIDQVGEPAAVVTAAGTDACGQLSEVDRESWERVVRVNLLGTAAVVRACLPALERMQGRIVTVGSTLGLKAVSDATAYCASKFGVVGFTRALAAELAGRVGVTMLVPGGMRTAFFADRPEQYRPADDAELMDPAEVAGAVLTVLQQPPGCVVRELVVTPSVEPSWP
ncbi:MAG TPA: SDR family oxidoreductase [Jiangellaceae bacterium]|nr:SDR family oxidoreductase [Jiangellaceae bacterium]